MPFHKRDLRIYISEENWNKFLHGTTIFIIDHNITGAFLWKTLFNVDLVSFLCTGFRNSGGLGLEELGDERLSSKN